MIKPFIILVALLSCFSSCQSNADEVNQTDLPESESLNEEKFQLHWEWEGEFTDEQKDKLMSWVQEVYDATMNTLGQYPFDIYVVFEPANSSGRPVPFGLASRRDGKNSVRFYVDPTASKEDLIADWTAPHELSHLAIPFVGKNSKWFSEGFATFLSRQIMMEMGQFTQEEFDQIYEDKIADSKKYYGSNTKTFVEVSDSLMSKYLYGAMYNGSTSFFLTIDQRLRGEKGIRFIHILQDYQLCCREKDRSLKDVIKSFDDIIGEPWCGELMNDYRRKPSIDVLLQY